MSSSGPHPTTGEPQQDQAPTIVHSTVQVDLEVEAASPVVRAFHRVTGSSAVFVPRHIALVSVSRNRVRSTLVLDGAWLELAIEASEVDRSLVESLDLPREAILAVLPGWHHEWAALDETSLKRRILDGICYVAA